MVLYSKLTPNIRIKPVYWQPNVEVMVNMFRETGIVKWFSRLKGYGFINPDQGGKEVFVHYSAIRGDGYKNLFEGDKVEYELIDRGKGPQAQNVEPRHQ